MNLNKTTRTICGILSIAAFFALLGVAGTYDKVEQVKYNMPDAIYYRIKSELGSRCTDKAITDTYLLNKKYYDTGR